MNKTVKAIRPYNQRTGSNFKTLLYNAWQNSTGKTKQSLYPPTVFHGIAHRIQIPTYIFNKNEALLRFVEAFTINFDCWPHYCWCETIPFIWDCWPSLYDRTEQWLKKHKVKTAIFTSTISAAEMQRRCPDMNILRVTEGINVTSYSAGKPLAERNVDFLEYGSKQRNLFSKPIEGINHVNSTSIITQMMTWETLVETMADAKVTLALPRCDVDPVGTEGLETLTQRFWEGMLSRSVLVGRAPKELIELIGYNPVIDLDRNNAETQIKNIIDNIEKYQTLVDRNRETALKMAPWDIRIKKIMSWLTDLGYKI